MPNQKTMIKNKNEFKAKALLIGMLTAYLFVIPFAYYYLYSLPKFNNEKLDFEKQKLEEQQSETRSYRKILDEKDRQREAKLDSCLKNAEGALSMRLWNEQCVTWKIQLEAGAIANGFFIQDNSGKCLLPTNISDVVWGRVKDAKEECGIKYGASC
jgi:hypothetical protein